MKYFFFSRGQVKESDVLSYEENKEKFQNSNRKGYKEALSEIEQVNYHKIKFICF